MIEPYVVSINGKTYPTIRKDGRVFVKERTCLGGFRLHDFVELSKIVPIEVLL